MPSWAVVPCTTVEGGKFLSDTTIVNRANRDPHRSQSLTTFKHIQESHQDYHSQTYTLTVGNPEVGEVVYNERRRRITTLTCARKEVEMIGRLLGVTPLVEDHATKQSVLLAKYSARLVNTAVHGNAKRGEIAFSPSTLTSFPPQEQDFVLTMSDILKVQLSANLVVLSCYHSARRQIRTEGVVGIAREFLGPSTCSVLAPRWALDDSATE
ncbi:Tetratricopeptide repeat protein 28 [Stylophora pistillata]|uniref:Tetratricopeptide repeat protein 28 n=1 Tax=Stylophora pistillata TaxID=50429 RepID=A0A2B4SIP1_STYPI|nr:Tetratricopeptide repeat protein 28 [Stylophora pistillata]